VARAEPGDAVMFLSLPKGSGFYFPASLWREEEGFPPLPSACLQRKTRQDFERIAVFCVPRVRFPAKSRFLDGATAAGACQPVPCPRGSPCPLLFISLALFHQEITGFAALSSAWVFFHPAFAASSLAIFCSSVSGRAGLSPLGQVDKLSPNLSALMRKNLKLSGTVELELCTDRFPRGWEGFWRELLARSFPYPCCVGEGKAQASNLVVCSVPGRELFPAGLVDLSQPWVCRLCGSPGCSGSSSVLYFFFLFLEIKAGGFQQTAEDHRSPGGSKFLDSQRSVVVGWSGNRLFSSQKWEFRHLSDDRASIRRKVQSRGAGTELSDVSVLLS